MEKEDIDKVIALTKKLIKEMNPDGLSIANTRKWFLWKEKIKAMEGNNDN